MDATHQVTPTESGRLRISMRRADKAGPRSARTFWNAEPLYRELVLRAKARLDAVADPAQHGYGDRGPVREEGGDLLDPHLTVCVEIIGPRAQLEHFCQSHGGQLAGKVIVYKHLEHRSVGPADLAPEAAPQARMAAY